MNKILNSKRVNQIFMDSLYESEKNDFIKAEGVSCTVGFDRQKIEKYRKEIELILNELPDKFKKSKGGGWSFVNACNDKNGIQWTGLHQRMEQLFQLGIAINKVTCPIPRKLCTHLPGGMPYFTIDDSTGVKE